MRIIDATRRRRSGRTPVVIATDVLALRRLDHGGLVIETGLTYDGLAPVRVHVTKREGRFLFSDEGGAVSAAAPASQPAFERRIVLGDRDVNVSRRGVVFVPAVASSSDEWLLELVGLVAEGSLALYEALLELDD